MLGAPHDVNGATRRATLLRRVLITRMRAALHVSGDVLSRIAIIGSCITRDLWPILGEEPENLLYVSRTSLPTLFASAPRGLILPGSPPGDLRTQPYAALVADVRKTALAALVAHRPTHVIFDFIDERFDLISVGGGLVAHTWEMDVSGLLDQPPFAAAQTIARASRACDLLWRHGAEEMAAFLSLTPLRDAIVVLHETRWATHYRDVDAVLRPFPPDIEILEGRSTGIETQNSRLEDYQAAFAGAVPRAVRVRAAQEYCVADVGHRWGLSPFHYVTDYYRDVWRQLRAAGV